MDLPPWVEKLAWGFGGALLLEAFRPPGPANGDGTFQPSPAKANLPLIGQIPTMYTPSTTKK